MRKLWAWLFSSRYVEVDRRLVQDGKAYRRHTFNGREIAHTAAPLSDEQVAAMDAAFERARKEMDEAFATHFKGKGK